MSRLVYALLVLAFAACEKPATDHRHDSAVVVAHRPIFRTVHLEHAEVTLGQPLRDKASLGQVLGDSVVRLANAKFGGAEAIWIQLTAGDTVRGMTYDYGVDTAFDSRVEEYTEILGPPTKRSTRGTRDEPRDVVQWDDSLTHFELRWIPRGAGAVAQSVLLDRRLAGF